VYYSALAIVGGSIGGFRLDITWVILFLKKDI